MSDAKPPASANESGPVAPTVAAGIAGHFNISAAEVATWSPNVARRPNILVPCQVDVLIAQNATVAPALCALQAVPGEPKALDIPQPFVQSDTPRKNGIYLLWTLPAALTSGVHDPLDQTPQPTLSSLKFPVIPDRWLVLRIGPQAEYVANAQAPKGLRSQRGWILQVGQNEVAPVDLATWVEPGPGKGPAGDPITAVNLGGATWSAYFDNAQNRLGFYDDLDGDAIGGSLSYVVIGWHSDQSNDLFADVDSPSAFFDQLQNFGWSLNWDNLFPAKQNYEHLLDNAKLAGLRLSTQDEADLVRLRTSRGWITPGTLFHGSVVNLHYSKAAGTSNALGGQPDPTKITTALGNTVVEALAASLAVTSPGPAVTGDQRLFEAYELGMLNELAQPDGDATLDALLHAASFNIIPGAMTQETITAPSRPASTTPAQSKPAPTPTATTATVAKAVASAAAAVHGFTFTSGTLNDARGSLGLTPTIVPPIKQTVNRAGARWYVPAEPVILLQGANRSFKRGFEGRFSTDGSLQCRISGDTIASFTAGTWMVATGATPPVVNGTEILDRLRNGSIPPDCQSIVDEVALLDTGSAWQIASAVSATSLRSGFNIEVTHRIVLTQMRAVWVARDIASAFAALSGETSFVGTFPSPIALTPAAASWNPRHFDYEVSYTPTPDGLWDWSLNEVDYVLPGALPEAGPAITVSGRGLLTGTAAAIAAAAASATSALAAAAPATDASIGQAEAPSPDAQLLNTQLAAQSSTLADLSQQLANMDVVSGALDGFNLTLRGTPPVTRISLKNPSPSELDSRQTTQVPPLRPLRAGTMKLVRLRVVDEFGQFVDVPLTSGAVVTVVPSMAVTEAPGVAALPPRLSFPSRLQLRYCAPDDSADASDTQDADTNPVTPVCGYIEPNHLDGSLMFYDASGTMLGSVAPNTADLSRPAGGRWVNAPGTSSTTALPSGLNATTHLARIAQGLVGWAQSDESIAEGLGDSALSAMLRIIDTTLWTVDPFAGAGQEHLALLVGHPLVVMRGYLQFDVSPNRPEAQLPQGAVLPVRLGALVQWQDGLMGYWVNDDYSEFHCVDASVAELAREIGPWRGVLSQTPVDPATQPASPVIHPFINTSGLIYVAPNTRIKLTMLVEAHSVVSVSCGVLPRKEIGMRRWWLGGLAKLAPMFSFQPALVDPAQLRMPVPTHISGTWNWAHYDAPGAWSDLASDKVIPATADALLPPRPARPSEGWLQLTPVPSAPTSS